MSGYRDEKVEPLSVAPPTNEDLQQTEALEKVGACFAQARHV